MWKMMKTKLKSNRKTIGDRLLVTFTILAIVFRSWLVIGYGVIGNGDPWSILLARYLEEILQKFSR